MVNILAIDGGALMGVVPARVLAYLDGSINTDQATVGDVTIPAAITVNGKAVPSLASGTEVATLYSSFGLIAGTSTGGLLACALTVPPLYPPKVSASAKGGAANSPMTGQQVLEFYCAEAATIFPNGAMLSEAALAVSLVTVYGNHGLAYAIQSCYGAPSWAHCVAGTGLLRKVDGMESPPVTGCAYVSSVMSETSLLVTSFNNSSLTYPLQVSYASNISEYGTPSGPIYIDQNTTVTPGTNTEDLSVLQACLMTSAFPALLPSVPYDLGFTKETITSPNVPAYFIDGGVYANNPTPVAYASAIQKGDKPNVILSLGCGCRPVSAGLTYDTVMDWGGGVGTTGWLDDGGTNVVSALSQMGANAVMADLLGRVVTNFFRIDPPISSDATAWNSSASALEGWIADADSYVQTLVKNGTWAALLNALTPPSA